jgi:hypothetical protein
VELLDVAPPEVGRSLFAWPLEDRPDLFLGDPILLHTLASVRQKSDALEPGHRSVVYTCTRTIRRETSICQVRIFLSVSPEATRLSDLRYFKALALVVACHRPYSSHTCPEPFQELRGETV